MQLALLLGGCHRAELSVGIEADDGGFLPDGCAHSLNFFFYPFFQDQFSSDAADEDG